MQKNSLTHPLRIDSVPVPGTGGLIGMTLCPGKVLDSPYSGQWRRDLGLDLEAIRAWDCQILVTLMERDEMARFQVADLPDRIPEGMEHVHLPIPDAGIPDAAWERAWIEVRPRVMDVLAAGGRIVTHCRGGLGRTGLLAARLLVEFGMAPKLAVDAVRRARPGTIETGEQLAYVLAQVPRAGRTPRPSHPADPDRTSRFRGCMLGGAVGDALGAPVEFMDLAEIRARFGPDGVRDMAPAYGRPGGAITDDTQMTLFTAEGFLRARVQEIERGISGIPGMVAMAYQRWLRTQGQGGPAAGERDGWLLSHRELFSRRAPGNTCLSALMGAARSGGSGPARNDSKGCGGVMRVAPVGLYAAGSHPPEQAFAWGCEVAALTHGHPTGQLPAGVLAAVICELASGGDLPGAIRHAKGMLRERPNHGETLDAIERAERLAANAGPDAEVPAGLGQGWVAEEALAIALGCALRAGSLEQGVIMAANIIGDSDSTAAITGNLLGAMLGVQEIPERWLAPLELRGVIIEVADDLATVHTWGGQAAAGDPGRAGDEMAHWRGRYGAH